MSLGSIRASRYFALATFSLFPATVVVNHAARGRNQRPNDQLNVRRAQSAECFSAEIAGAARVWRAVRWNGSTSFYCRFIDPLFSYRNNPRTTALGFTGREFSSTKYSRVAGRDQSFGLLKNNRINTRQVLNENDGHPLRYWLDEIECAPKKVASFRHSRKPSRARIERGQLFAGNFVDLASATLPDELNCRCRSQEDSQQRPSTCLKRTRMMLTFSRYVTVHVTRYKYNDVTQVAPQ